jgi:hypothetical protein
MRARRTSMDRPLRIVVVDSLDTLQRFEPLSLNADVVLVAAELPDGAKHRVSWGHARLLSGPEGSDSAGGVSIGWTDLPKNLSSLLEELSHPSKLLVSSGPTPEELLAEVEARALCVAIGQGIYRFELGRTRSGADVARLVDKREIREPRAPERVRAPARSRSRGRARESEPEQAETSTDTEDDAEEESPEVLL